jgi:hypothetical protein
LFAKNISGAEFSAYLDENLERPTMKKKESALSDKIVDLCKRGRLRSPFGVANIRNHFGENYADSHIRTVLANYCEGTGYEVKQGRVARFKRVSKGEYVCI